MHPAGVTGRTACERLRALTSCAASLRSSSMCSLQRRARGACTWVMPWPPSWLAPWEMSPTCQAGRVKADHLRCSQHEQACKADSNRAVQDHLAPLLGAPNGYNGSHTNNVHLGCRTIPVSASTQMRVKIHA